MLPPNMLGNINNVMQKFSQFKQNFERNNPNANPKSMVQDLLNSGRMTQAQFEQCRNMANMITGMKM